MIGTISKLLLVIILSFLGTGCGAIVGGAVGGSIVAEELKKTEKEYKDTAVLSTVEPDQTIVKLWFCSSAGTSGFIFSDESWNSCSNSPKRQIIQSTIRMRYSNYEITKIERARDGVNDVLFIHLKERISNR